METEVQTEEKNINSIILALRQNNFTKFKKLCIFLFLSNIILNSKSLSAIIDVEFSEDGPIYEPSPIEIMDEVNPIMRVILSILLVFDVIGYLIIANRYKINPNDENLKKKMKILRVASIILLFIFMITFIISGIIQIL